MNLDRRLSRRVITLDAFRAQDQHLQSLRTRLHYNAARAVDRIQKERRFAQQSADGAQWTLDANGTGHGGRTHGTILLEGRPVASVPRNVEEAL